MRSLPQRSSFVFKRFHPQLYIGYAPRARGTFASPSQPEIACWTSGLYLEDPPADWEDAYRVTLALVRAFVDRSHSNGIEPVIMVVPTPCQLQNDRFVAESSDLLRPQEQLAQALQGDAELIDLFPPFQHDGERRGSADWYRLERDGHFNAEGHAFVAQLLAERIGKWLAGQRSTDSSAAVTDQRAATQF